MFNKLDERIKILKEENKDLREQLNYYNKRVQIIDEKEKRYDEMLAYLETQKIALKNEIQKTKELRKIMEKEFNKIK